MFKPNLRVFEVSGDPTQTAAYHWLVISVNILALGSEEMCRRELISYVLGLDLKGMTPFRPHFSFVGGQLTREDLFPPCDQLHVVDRSDHALQRAKHTAHPQSDQHTE